MPNQFDVTTAITSAKQFLDPIAFNVFQEVTSSEVLDAIAMDIPAASVHVQEDDEGEYVLFEGKKYFAKLLEWSGVRRPWDGGHKATWRIPNRSYHATEQFKWKRFRGDTPQATEMTEQRMLELEEIAEALLATWPRDPADFLHEILARNKATAYDGKPLIDHDHQHIDGSAFSNAGRLGVDLPAWVDPAAPSFEEAYAALIFARNQLRLNRLHINRVQRVNRKQRHVAIVRSPALLEVFEEITSTEKVKVGEGNDRTDRANPFFGRLVFDFDHKAQGDFSSSFDLVPIHESGDVESGTGGMGASAPVIRQPPKCLTKITTLEPDGVEFDDRQMFDSKQLRLGIDGEMALGAGFPSEVFRVYNVEKEEVEA